MCGLSWTWLPEGTRRSQQGRFGIKKMVQCKKGLWLHQRADAKEDLMQPIRTSRTSLYQKELEKLTFILLKDKRV
jgi:hypothetical protein